MYPSSLALFILYLKKTDICIVHSMAAIFVNSAFSSATFQRRQSLELQISKRNARVIEPW